MTAVQTRVRDLSRQVSVTRDARSARDLALLVARIALAWLFIYHGCYTLFGAFGGSGLHGATIFFDQVAHLSPGGFFAAVAGITELVGGAAVGLGVFGRLGAVGLIVTMVMAMITVTFSNGIASTVANVESGGGGYELNVALIALSAVIAIMGTGRLSLDVLLRRWLLRGSPSKAHF